MQDTPSTPPSHKAKLGEGEEQNGHDAVQQLLHTPNSKCKNHAFKSPVPSQAKQARDGMHGVTTNVN